MIIVAIKNIHAKLIWGGKKQKQGIQDMEKGRVLPHKGLI